MTVGSSSELHVYGSGAIVAHDRDHHEDRCGKLSLEPLDEAVWAPFEIRPREVEPPLNRASRCAVIGIVHVMVGQ